MLLQTGALNGVIEDAIAAQAGRPARLEQAPSLGFEGGALTLDLGPLTVANADWADQPDLARIQQVHASLRLAPLLTGRIEFPDVVIEAPQLHLARGADGKVNWPEAGEPEGGPVQLPKIENLVIRDADVTYADAAASTDAHLVLHEATGRLGGDQDLALNATGRLQDAPLELSAKGGSLAELLDRGAMAEPSTLEVMVGNSRITAQTTSFANLQSLDAKVEIDAAQTLAELLSSVGIATADLPPFKASMQIEPGEGGSLITGDVSAEGASIHLDGKIDDPSAPLDAFEASLKVDAPELGPILASFKVPSADQLSSAKLDAKVEHRAASTTIAANGDVAGDAIKVDAAYQGTLTAFLDPRADLHLEGSALGTLPAQLGFARRPIKSYRIDLEVEEQSDKASPVKLDLAIEDTQVQFDGHIDELRTLKGVDGQVRVQGPNPAAVLDLFKLPVISVPPYDFAGHITWRGDDVKVAGLDGTFGDSDAHGDIAIDLRPTPPAVTADLRSDRLVMADLAGVIGATNTEKKPGKLLPTGKIDPKAWQKLDMDVRYKTARIESTYLPIDRIEAHIITKKGWLTLDPVRTGLADGAITGFASLDGTQDPPAGDFDFRLEALQLQDMLAKLGVSGEGLGEIDGRIQLKGKGRSVDALLGSADGQAVLSMAGGSIDALILEAIGLDIAESIVVLLDSADQPEDDKVPIRCAIVNLQVDQGIATAQPVVIDTTDSKITVDGKINLKEETLDIMIQSHPKDTSLFSANQPIHVEGALLSPSASPAPGEVENEALGWLLAPVAAVLPFFDVGGEPDSPCGNLIAQAKEAAAARPK